MQYEMKFGNLSADVKPRTAAGKKFRIALLGDFSAAANLGRLETGEDLAARKPQRIDVDNLDEVLDRMKLKLTLPVAADGGTVELSIGEMDDFHPDQLYDAVELFSEFAGLRQRLKGKGTFAAAAKEMQEWAGDIDEEDADYSAPRKGRGSAIPGGKLSDFARLVGTSTATATEATDADDLIRSIVGPYVVAAKDPQQDKLVAAVDNALTDAMRRVLHHPDFQTVESLWRSVELLVRKLETGAELEIVLFDLTAEELAADLSRVDSLEECGLYKLLVEQPSLDDRQGPFSVIVGNYTFEQTPPHAELLGRMAKLACTARAPFLAGVSNDVLKKLKPEEVHPLVKQSWDSLRALPEAAYLGLVVPRFLLRWPYGKKTEPIDSFAFEEFSMSEGVRGMLWGNGAVIAALLLAETFQQQGMKGMKLGSVMSVGEMPYYYFTDADGDQVALPCTDRLLSESLSAHVSSQGLIPLLSIKGRAEVRLASFQSPAGKPILGPWSTEHVTPSAGSASAAPATAAAPAAAAVAEPAAAPVAEAAPAEEAAAAVESADAELDALLASLGAEEPPPTPAAPAGTDDAAAMDAELAALLADL